MDSTIRGFGVASVVQTRVSLGSQLRAALGELRLSGAVNSWSVGDSNGRLLYMLDTPSGERFIMSPGECMDWLNGRFGYNIRVGKS